MTDEMPHPNDPAGDRDDSEPLGADDPPQGRGAVSGVVEPDDEDGLFPAPVAAAPHTGDDVIDSALARLERSATSGSLDDQVEAGEHVHQTLQGRLADLGGG
jgi:hypothetical protein